MDVFLHNFFNIETLIVYYPILLRGLWMTLLLCVIIVPLGIHVLHPAAALGPDRLTNGTKDDQLSLTGDYKTTVGVPSTYA